VAVKILKTHYSKKPWSSNRTTTKWEGKEVAPHRVLMARHFLTLRGTSRKNIKRREREAEKAGADRVMYSKRHCKYNDSRGGETQGKERVPEKNGKKLAKDARKTITPFYVKGKNQGSVVSGEKPFGNHYDGDKTQAREEKQITERDGCRYRTDAKNKLP